MVAASTFLNAASTGAKTVKSPLFRVLTRLTFGLTLPDTAATSVVSSGLFEAAVATGSVAMPPTEPAPEGTALAYAAHPGPTRAAPAALAPEDIAPDIGAEDMAPDIGAEDMAPDIGAPDIGALDIGPDDIG